MWGAWSHSSLVFSKYNNGMNVIFLDISPNLMSFLNLGPFSKPFNCFKHWSRKVHVKDFEFTLLIPNLMEGKSQQHVHFRELFQCPTYSFTDPSLHLQVPKGSEKVLKWTVTLFATRWQKGTMDCQEGADYPGRYAGCLCDQRASPGHPPHPLKTFYSHHHHRHRHSPYQLPLSNFNNRSWSEQTFTGLKHTCHVYYQKFPWKLAFHCLFYNDSYG